jgi:hypothetical protein
MIEILALGAAKALKIAALTTAGTFAGLATGIAPATDRVVEALTCRAHCGAERATVRAISWTNAAASASASPVRCSTVSCEVWILRDADPST